MMKNNISDSKALDDVKIHQTKCSNFINNTRSSHFKQDLPSDIGNNNKFSLLLDESRNISMLKMFRVSAIYYSDSKNKAVSTYLELVQIKKCDA